MIKIRELKKKYSSDFTLDIDKLDIEDGERLALVGANGSGKSTLLRLISGYTSPDSGTIEGVCEAGDMIYIPQDAFIFSSTVEKNVAAGLGGHHGKNSEKAVSDALDKVGLSSHAGKKAYKLSGGEAQRAVFARLLIRPHKLVLLDEPFSAVDVDFSDSMYKLLLDYCSENNSTLVFSTHLPYEAMKISTKLAIMHNGKIAEYGKAEELIRNPSTDFGKKFLARRGAGDWSDNN